LAAFFAAGFAAGFEADALVGRLLVAGVADAPPLVVSADGEAAAGMPLVGRFCAWAPAVPSSSNTRITEDQRNKTGIRYR
jgi:hypothetical protein